MLKMGLDLGTGFVKCVSDYGSVRFPSIYVKRVHGSWTNKVTEAVGTDAVQMINTMGTSAIKPINRGRPDSRHSHPLELLIKETVHRVYGLVHKKPDPSEKIKMVVGLPYYAFNDRDMVVRMIKKCVNLEGCDVVAQASGTLIDLNRKSGIIISIGQGTTEIVVIDDLEVIDGHSSGWASDFVTKKIGPFAHLDVSCIMDEADTCKRYSKILAENLAREVFEVSENYNNKYDIALSGGGLLLPGVNGYLTSNLKKFKMLIPDDPVMSNARGLYKLAK